MARFAGDVAGKSRKGLSANDNGSTVTDWVLLWIEGLFSRRPWVRLGLAVLLLFAPVCVIGYVFLR